MDTYEHIECESAAQFLETLRRSNELWRDGVDVDWLFRGQQRASWSLIPSAYRDENSRSDLYSALLRIAKPVAEREDLREYLRSELRLWHPTPDDEALRRALVVAHVNTAERLGVDGFLEMVDRLGLRVPTGRAPAPAKHLGLTPSDEVTDGPHPIYALAQHHGCPTRLLDWTLNPLNAAYFAAQDVNPEEDGHLAVWAVHIRALAAEWRIYTVPRSEIGYLHAQEGIFIRHPNVDRFFVFNGRWPRLDDGSIGLSNLRLVTLPNKESNELLRRLWVENVSLAHLMPTHDNISRTLDLFFKKIVRSHPAE